MTWTNPFSPDLTKRVIWVFAITCPLLLSVNLNNKKSSLTSLGQFEKRIDTLNKRIYLSALTLHISPEAVKVVAPVFYPSVISWKYMKYLPLDVKQPSINQPLILAIGIVCYIFFSLFSKFCDLMMIHMKPWKLVFNEQKIYSQYIEKLNYLHRFFLKLNNDIEINISNKSLFWHVLFFKLVRFFPPSVYNILTSYCILIKAIWFLIFYW